MTKLMYVMSIELVICNLFQIMGLKLIKSVIENYRNTLVQ